MFLFNQLYVFLLCIQSPVKTFFTDRNLLFSTKHQFDRDKQTFFFQANFAHQDEVLLGLGTKLKITRIEFRLNPGDKFFLDLKKYNNLKKTAPEVQKNYMYINIIAEEVVPSVRRASG